MTGCAAITAVALFTRPGASDALAACDHGGEAGAVWNPLERARTDAALRAMTTPDASGTRGRILDRLDDYRERWVALDRDACVSHRRGEHSDVLFDRQALCLQKRLGDLRATVAVLEQPSSADHAADVVASMPGVADCADAESLLVDVPPPSRPAQRTVVQIVRSHISQAMALHRAGRSTDALATATAAIAEAEASDYPPVVADAALTQGRILLERRQFDQAIPLLRHARDLALRQRQFAVAVEAAARLIYSEGMAGADAAVAQRDADIFIPLGEGLTGDHFAGPLLLSNIGNVYMAAGDRAAATQYFQRAHDALAGVQHPDLELTCIDSNLAMVAADPDQRESLARGVWQRLRDELGPSHLQTLDALMRYGRLVAEPAKALPLLAEACSAYGKLYPELVDARVYCESSRAFLAGEVGDDAEEMRLYEEIISIAGVSADRDTVARAILATGYVRLLRGDASGAITTLTRVVTTNADSPRWWERVLAAHAQLGIGLAERALGHRSAADHLRRAIAIYRGIVPLHEWAEYPRRMALASRTLIALR